MADLLWTGNGDGSSWTDAANWDTNTVPTAVDNVTINGFVDVTLDTNATVATLNLNGGADLTNSGELNVTTLNWTAGTFAGTGSINIPATTGTLNISGTGSKTLNTTINNAGTATWTGTADISSFDGTFNNSGQFDIQTSQTFNPILNNTGTVTKSAGNGTVTFNDDINNSGTVDVQIGTVSLGDFSANHTNTGTLNVADGATLEVSSGTLTLNPGTTFTGTGLVRLSGFSTTIALETSPATPVNIANFTQEGGTFNGGGTLNITGNLNWTGGTQGGAGNTTLAAGAIGNISGTDQKSLTERTFNNQGTTTWSGTGNISAQDGATFNNSSTLDIQNSELFFGDSDGSTSFNNSGTVTKSAGTANTDFGDNVFNNTGTVNVQTGTLFVGDGGGSSTGTYNVADGAVLGFGEASGFGSHTLNDGVTFTGQGLVRLIDGTLNLETAADSQIAIANFEQTGGTLAGTGNFRVVAPTPAEGETPQTSSFTWSGGTQSGTGTTTIGAGTTANINGTTQKTLTQRTFNNESTITWSGTGNLSAQDGATFNNAGTLDIENSQVFFGDNADGSTFNNTGTVTKSAGTGATDFADNAFNNTGTVNVQTGTLFVGDGGGSSTGTFNVADGAVLGFGEASGFGSNTLNDGVTFTGQGLVRLIDGTLNVETAADSQIAIANFEQTGGTLAGAGNFRVAAPTPAEGETPQTSSFTWSGGTQSGTGTTTIVAGTTANISGTDQKSLTERTFTNESTVTWTGTGNISAQDGATFNNIGTFDIQNSESFFGDFDGSTSFNNSGTITKTLSTGATDFEDNVFNNTGTVDAQIGSILLGNGGTSTGTFNTAEGAVVEFDGGTHNLNQGAAFTGEGTTIVSGGTFSVGGATTDTINAVNFEQSGGTVNGPGNLNTTGTFEWSGGTQGGVGSTTIGAAGTLNITGNFGQTIDERTIDNNGTTNWSGTGNINANNGAIFNNNGTFNISNNATYNGDFSSTAEQFNNAGSVVKTSAGDTQFEDVVFTNSGTIELQEGNLSVVRETFVSDGGTITEVNGTVDLTETDVVAQNTVPTLDVNAGLTIEDGATLPILNTNLQITDVEQPAEEITYTVNTLPTVGNLLLSGTPLAVGGTFTQANINGSQLLYQNNDGGGDVGDSFVFTATDGAGGVIGQTTFNITVTPVPNQPPVLSINGGVSLDDGANAAISNAVLTVTDPDNTSDEVTYTVTELPTNGQLLLDGAPVAVNGMFTQANINAGLLTYQNTAGGNEQSDNFTFTVSDGEGGEIAATSFDITVNQTPAPPPPPPPNEPPVLATNAGVSLDDGANAAISNAVLAVTDTDNPPNEVTYTVTELPTNGQLILDGAAVAVNGTFTQANINAGLLTYQNTAGGNEQSDNFTFTVSDGEGGEIAATSFDITVNQPAPPPPPNEPPVLATNAGVSLDDGANAAISNAVLAVTDTDNPPNEVTYTVTELPTNGQLILDGAAVAVNGTFTQANI
ncbi:cadherin-like domain-containing protein, partial [Okeania sp. SIO1I7]|uniref:beta strand repeat-containing protein n=1 Tax=Okeania sp. SIO1I7 TaxID=2607772 RepID=UPI0013FCF2D3